MFVTNNKMTAFEDNLYGQPCIPSIDLLMCQWRSQSRRYDTHATFDCNVSQPIKVGAQVRYRDGLRVGTALEVTLSSVFSLLSSLCPKPSLGFICVVWRGNLAFANRIKIPPTKATRFKMWYRPEGHKCPWLLLHQRV
jgi:hypothetical protein